MSTCQSGGCAGGCAGGAKSATPAGGAPVVSTFSVPKMDCPSEENLIRMTLSGLPGVGTLSFDLAERQLKVVHSGEPALIAERLAPLNLGASLLETAEVLSRGASQTRFAIPKMDCPSEENLIRMALADAVGVGTLAFDLNARELTVVHEGGHDPLLALLAPLNLGARVLVHALV